MKIYEVTINTMLCTFCEVCVKKCPTQSLQLDEGEDIVSIVFHQERCDGCEKITSNSPRCQTLCPESALCLSRTNTKKAKPSSVIQGQLQKCPKCKSIFVATLKIEKVLKKKNIRKKDVHNFCPDCRAKLLVENLLTEGKK